MSDPQAAAEIRALVEGYAVAADTLDAELFRSLWTADAELTIHRGGEQTGHYDGVDDMPRLIDTLRSRYRHTVHVVGSHRVALRDDGRLAVGVTSGVGHHIGPVDGGPAWNRQIGLRYIDGFRLEDGAWRLASRQCHQLWQVENAVEAS
ncbi:MAG: nuclear transport factor 2 family protein [Actinomycetota bacterium]|nr:nuclear transport factor 2 family protein [Acidimicrobiia bacterium]MDQ3294398.1 nuclear transport factor 2 family protein [Actinomycetota bacterium]